MGLAAVPAAALLGKEKLNSRVGGVMLGAQSYSFREMTLDQVIEACKELELGFIELWEGHVLPASAREQKRWRSSAVPIEMRLLRKKFDDAGINIYAWNYGFHDDLTDGEIQHAFELAKALGVRYLTTSSSQSTVARIDPVARRYKIVVGIHNHSEIKKGQFATPDDLAAAIRDNTNIGINLDIGHFTAAGFDPVKFLEQNHERIVTLHIRDRKQKQGPDMPFGQGDTPIKEVLLVLRRTGYRIPAMIEYEYTGGNPIDEVRRCFDYCKQALMSS